MRTIAADVSCVEWKYGELISSVHEPETRSTDKHVKIDRAVSSENPFQRVGKLWFQQHIIIVILFNFFKL